MLGIIVILLLTVYIAFFYPIFKKKEVPVSEEKENTVKVKKLWSIAQTSMREKKPMRAEKALLTILKFDEKNAAAYNRLGILYAKSKKFDEAIECFEIAQSLDNNASSLHNAGLIYLETGAYEKAVMAFEQAIELEGDLPARFVALAKAQEKLGNRKAAIDALETAFDLDHSATTLRQILAIHEESGNTEAIAATQARIEEQIASETTAKKKPVIRKRLVRSARVARPVAKPAAKPVAKPRKAPLRPARRPARPATKPVSRKISVNSASAKPRRRKII